MQNLPQIIEALVFASGRVVAADEIREAVTQVTGEKPPADSAISVLSTVSGYDGETRGAGAPPARRTTHSSARSS